ncbi:hypothetical protein V6615_14225 [Oscillospiraceae bacterium PP1C4]
MESRRRKNEHFYEPYYNKVLLILKYIEELLKQKPDVSNITWTAELRKEHTKPFIDYMQLESDYLMQFSFPIKFNVFWLICKREYQLPILYVEKAVQRFSVIYNGTVFMAYAPIQDDLSEGTMLV